MWLTTRRSLTALFYSFLFLSVLVNFATSQKGRMVNCKKMVFAPICRGVAAKRSGQFYPTYPHNFQALQLRRRVPYLGVTDRQTDSDWQYLPVRPSLL